MPKGTKVARCVEHVEDQGHDKVSAIKICQTSTGDAYSTGKPSKKAMTTDTVKLPKMSAPVRPQKTTVMKTTSTNRFTPPKHVKRPHSAEEVQYDKSLVGVVKAQPRANQNQTSRVNIDRSDSVGSHTVNNPAALTPLSRAKVGAKKPSRKTDLKKSLADGTKGSTVPSPSKPQPVPKPNAAAQHYQTQDNKYKLDTKPANSPVSMLGMGDRNVKHNKSIVDKTIIKNLFQQSSKMLVLCDKMLGQTANIKIKSLIVDKMKELAKELDDLEKMSKSL